MCCYRRRLVFNRCFNTKQRCLDVCSDSTITNFLLILTVKKVWKLVNMWWSYKAYKKCANFLDHPVHTFLFRHIGSTATLYNHTKQVQSTPQKIYFLRLSDYLCLCWFHWRLLESRYLVVKLCCQFLLLYSWAINYLLTRRAAKK